MPNKRTPREQPDPTIYTHPLLNVESTRDGIGPAVRIIPRTGRTAVLGIRDAVQLAEALDAFILAHAPNHGRLPDASNAPL